LFALHRRKWEKGDEGTRWKRSVSSGRGQKGGDLGGGQRSRGEEMRRRLGLTGGKQKQKWVNGRRPGLNHLKKRW